MPFQIPEDLCDALRRRRAHLFVGSGVSAAASLLSWDGLVGAMTAVIRSEATGYSAMELEAFLTKADHLDIAELFRDTVKERAYINFLRSHYRKEVPISALHRAVARLPVATIITTNYDKLLEVAFRRKGLADPSVIIYPSQLGYLDDAETRIVKLHGDIDHPSTVVLTRSDYAAYASRHTEFESQFKRSINDHTLLLVGFGLRDSNFRRIYNDARSFFDTGKCLAYAIMAGTNAIERRLWEAEGLKIIPVSSHKQVPSLVRQIATRAAGAGA